MLNNSGTLIIAQCSLLAIIAVIINKIHLLILLLIVMLVPVTQAISSSEPIFTTYTNQKISTKAVKSDTGRNLKLAFSTL